MEVTQIFWGEFADTEVIRARYVVCGRWCKFVPDCCNAGEQILDLIGKSLSDEGNALVMSSQVYAHASERQSQSSDSGENLLSESESGLNSGSKLS